MSKISLTNGAKATPRCIGYAQRFKTLRLTRLVCLGCLVLVLASTGYSQQVVNEKVTGASINGSVPALDLKANQRAVITWTRQVTDEPTKAPVSGAVLTDEKGQFTIDASAGTYALCVRVPGTSFLDPCVWDDSIPTVSVKSGEKSKNVRLDVREGVLFQFQVADTEKKVASLGKGTGVVLDATFELPNGRFVKMPMVKSDSGGHTLELLVPADRDLPLLIEGQGLLFLDENGEPWARDRAPYVIKKNTAGEKSKITKIQVKGH